MAEDISDKSEEELINIMDNVVCNKSRSKKMACNLMGLHNLELASKADNIMLEVVEVA
jgi:hypothetical protein